MIVIVSSTQDEHAKAVNGALDARGARALLLDLTRFPQGLQLSLSYDGGTETARLVGDGVALGVGEWRAIWWRRPGLFVTDPSIRRASHSHFAYSECTEAFSGLWHLLDASWINAPWHDDRAARKVFQLKVARQSGLAIPRTLISNDPEEARAFAEAMGPGRLIYKAFSATQEEWRETRLLGERELGQLESVRLAPVIFQEYIEADVDIRVTVVGQQVFAAAIHSQDSAYKVDFRMDMSGVKVQPVELPEDVSTGLLELMRRLQLVYGAIDLRRTPDGRYVFLEINPAGQWLFIEERTGLPITAALASELIAMDDRPCSSCEEAKSRHAASSTSSHRKRSHAKAAPRTPSRRTEVA